MSVAVVTAVPRPSATAARTDPRLGPGRVDEDEPEIVSVMTALMGGTVGIHLRPVDGTTAGAAEARRAARSTLGRMAAWADRLTRFSTSSDLARLNAATATRVPIGPTMAAALDWARMAEGLSDGIVDVAMLDARLAAEHPDLAGGSEDPPTGTGSIDRTWSLGRDRRATHVRRPVGLRFDLDGVAKGWLADRALDRLHPFPAAAVDADGDIAIKLACGERWRLGVADPRSMGEELLALDLVGPDRDGVRHFGLATSGTSVHRWVHGDRVAHHLIDPRTGRPARTDIVQATVLARTAREAEALAKTAVILGSEAAFAVVGRPGVDGAILLTDRDELLLTPTTIRWLA